ncbi:MAG: hypothetical protein ACD_47C00232G0002 [uncultured bacterium]|nr:MAG: hypothetical protein ACD_47C00232G0002 [uncultured bacterium]
MLFKVIYFREIFFRIDIIFQKENGRKKIAGRAFFIGVGEGFSLEIGKLFDARIGPDHYNAAITVFSGPDRGKNRFSAGRFARLRISERAVPCDVDLTVFQKLREGVIIGCKHEPDFFELKLRFQVVHHLLVVSNHLARVEIGNSPHF